MEIAIVIIFIVILFFIIISISTGKSDTFKINTLGRKYIKHIEYGQKVGAFKASEGLSKIENEITDLGYDPDSILTEYGDAKFENRAPDYSRCKKTNA